MNPRESDGWKLFDSIFGVSGLKLSPESHLMITKHLKTMDELEKKRMEFVN
ncbi:MAG: hypothetical protein KGI28_01565 [Thaumarchaeota archaeon]|nr:hypothetical protein [Nitrososphaerota archaeon]